MSRCYWSDDAGDQQMVREITRPAAGTLVYPGGNEYRWAETADGWSETHVNTGATTYYTEDDRHNVSGYWTDLETSPLVRIQHTYGGASGNQIVATQVTTHLPGQPPTSWDSKATAL